MKYVPYRSGGTVALLATAALLALSLPGFAATISEGTLELNLGSTNQWVYGSTTQLVKVKGSCELDQSSTPTLVSIGTTDGTPGFNKQKEWFGVKENSNGVGCGRISGSQSLTISLTGVLADKLVNKSTLALNAKKNVVITATTYHGGTQTGQYVLRTGASAPVGVDPGTNEAFCNPGVSDSNPDSNADCVWVFPNTNKSNPDTPADWDHVTFTVSVGEFGLGGPNTISTFRIGVEADGELGCPGDSNTFERTDNDIVYVGTRLDNVTADGAPPPTCQAVPYTASNTCPTGSTATQCTNFVYDPLDQGTHMAFYFKWIWGPEPMPTPPPGGTIANSVPPTLQFFLNGNATGIALDFCPGIEPLFDDNGTPEDPTDDIFLGLASPIPPSLDQDPSVPGTQAGCLITRQVIQDGTLIQLIEGAYVQGDYAARRF